MTPRNQPVPVSRRTSSVLSLCFLITLGLVAGACGDDGAATPSSSSPSGDEPEPQASDGAGDPAPASSAPDLPPSSTSVAPSTPPSERGLLTDRTIDIDGVDRSYHLYLPPRPAGAALVLLFHGNSTSPDQILGLAGQPAPYRVWLDIAERDGLIVVVPRGDGGWNDCRADAPTNPTSDDVAFISALIDEVVTAYGADSQRVFATGTSNGGHMSIRLAEEVPEKITAFAAVAASNAVNSECTTSTVPVSAMFLNGTADQLLPYDGGAMINGAQVLSAEAALTSWAERNSATTELPEEQRPDLDESDGSTVTVTGRTGGSAGTEAALYTVNGGGHIEPSLAERYVGPVLTRIGPQNADIEMAEEVWAFFAEKSR